jgi:dipeptidyl aminopeptidase/acylaminoacyl peptidase
MITRLRGHGLDVWYLRAADEGHEFRKKTNRDAYFRTFAQFLAGLR